jgi:hypothetical protein
MYNVESLKTYIKENPIEQYIRGLNYLENKMTAPPFNFRWNPRAFPKSRPPLIHGTSIILAVRDNKTIPPFEPFNLIQRSISYNLPLCVCDFPRFTTAIYNLSDNLSVIEHMLETGEVPFTFNNMGRIAQHISFVAPYEMETYIKDKPCIKKLETNNEFLQRFEIFNFFENTTGTIVEKTIRTIEFAKQFLTYDDRWDHNDKEAFIHLKIKFLRNDEIKMSDWAGLL